MPRTIFHTTEKSNFILNMNLDRYRAFCGKLMAVILWITAVSAGIYQLTYSINSTLSDMTAEEGFAPVLAFILITLRSVANIFSVCGVCAIIAMVVGLMRAQFPKSAVVPYCLLLGSLIWGIVSMTQSFSTQQSLFGMDGRDEGLIVLLMYAAMFYLGSMLRRKENLRWFLDAVMIFGIAQCLWGFLQAQPFFDFPTEYRWLEPLSLDRMRLPNGFTDSPVTFAMLLAMLLAVAIPAAFCSTQKKRRVLALICAGCAMLLTFKTQTIAGLIAGVGALVFTVVVFCVKRKQITGKKWVLPTVMATAAVCSAVWVFFSPTINGSFHTTDDSALENGFALYDGGIVWDDGFYRLGTSGPYLSFEDHDFDIDNPISVLGFCWGDACKVIAKYPLVGTGPDNYAYTQLHTSMAMTYNSNTIDRPYNDYLFIAATRGIPSLLLHLVLLGFCFAAAWKRRKSAEGWMLLSAGGAAVLYALTAVVGVSVLTVAPLFWILLGILVGDLLADPKPREKNGQKQKKPAKASKAKV